jgi:hypothetical protein
MGLLGCTGKGVASRLAISGPANSANATAAMTAAGTNDRRRLTTTGCAIGMSASDGRVIITFASGSSVGSVGFDSACGVCSVGNVSHDDLS